MKCLACDGLLLHRGLYDYECEDCHQFYEFESEQNIGKYENDYINSQKDTAIDINNKYTNEWIKCKDRLPKLRDDSVLVFFSENQSIGMVHIQDYFSDITAGRDDKGELKYTKWYLSQGVTHWMELPNIPNQI